MLNMFYDFVPVLLFFLAFKWYGMYVATVVGIVATGLQVLLTRLIKKMFNKQQVITFLVFLLFGSMTLYFHNPIFVKWKPTIVFWIMGVALLISQYIGKKPIMQRMLENIIEEKASLPSFVWQRLNLAWTLFFLILGGVNLYIAYFFSDDTWVNFKFYGILGVMLIFSFLQALYLSKHMTMKNESN